MLTERLGFFLRYRNAPDSTPRTVAEPSSFLADLSLNPCALADTLFFAPNLSRLTLSYNPSNVVAAAVLPSGWAASGCMTEATTGRALLNATTSSSSMDTTTCVNYCATKGFRIAGVEYGMEW